MEGGWKDGRKDGWGIFFFFSFFFLKIVIIEGWVSIWICAVKS